jgi:hypothetical protein
MAVSRLIHLKMVNILDQVVEKTNTNFFARYPFYRKSSRLSANIEIYCRAIQATDDDIMCALFMLDT